jgi:hypothetical protein
MAQKRALVVGACIAAVLAGCGGGELSLTEYVEQVNAIVEVAVAKGDELTTDAAAVSDFTPQIMAAGLERALEELRIPLQEAADGIKPPAEVAELHDFLWGWHARFIAVEQELASRAVVAEDTDESWIALSETLR